MRGLLLFLILLPVVDLALLGHWLGFWNTLLLVLGTACLGFALIRFQGLVALKMGQQKLQAGVMPISEMTTGLFLAFAGLLFIHPGFLTDVMGLMCLVPGVRLLLAGWLMKKVGPLSANTAGGFKYSAKGHNSAKGFNPDQGYGSAGQKDVIEGEYEQVDNTPKHIDITQEKK